MKFYEKSNEITVFTPLHLMQRILVAGIQQRKVGSSKKGCYRRLESATTLKTAIRDVWNKQH